MIPIISFTAAIYQHLSADQSPLSVETSTLSKVAVGRWFKSSCVFLRNSKSDGIALYDTLYNTSCQTHALLSVWAYRLAVLLSECWKEIFPLLITEKNIIKVFPRDLDDWDFAELLN